LLPATAVSWSLRRRGDEMQPLTFLGVFVVVPFPLFIHTVVSAAVSICPLPLSASCAEYWSSQTRHVGSLPLHCSRHHHLTTPSSPPLSLVCSSCCRTLHTRDTVAAHPPPTCQKEHLPAYASLCQDLQLALAHLQRSSWPGRLGSP
jgi:hypothetical protein